MKNSFEKAGAVVMDDEGRVLIATSADGQRWVLPKGHVDPGETAEQTALRELEEETGWQGEIIRSLGDTFQRGKVSGERYTIYWYLVRPVEQRGAGEGRRLQWVSPDEARQQIVPEQVPVLEMITENPSL